MVTRLVHMKVKKCHLSSCKWVKKTCFHSLLTFDKTFIFATSLAFALILPVKCVKLSVFKPVLL